MQKFGDWEVHYILVPTTFLKPAIAEQYGIVRGRDRAYLNISVLDRGLDPVPVDIDGTMTNLLGQQQHLEFREVREGNAIYYLTAIKYTDREVLRFEILLTPPEDSIKTLKFQQKMYWDGR
jgi:hypothetical protein